MSQIRQIPRYLRPNLLFNVSIQSRPFTHTPLSLAKPLPPRLKLNDADLTISYLKGTGPGGQKINKTNSAVQISHKPTGIVIKSQATRSQSQNEKIARSLLADRVEAQLNGDQSRIALKAAVAKKKKASKIKKAKRKYRELEAGAEAKEKGEEDGVDEVDELCEGVEESRLKPEVERDSKEDGSSR